MCVWQRCWWGKQACGEDGSGGDGGGRDTLPARSVFVPLLRKASQEMFSQKEVKLDYEGWNWRC